MFGEGKPVGVENKLPILPPDNKLFAVPATAAVAATAPNAFDTIFYIPNTVRKLLFFGMYIFLPATKSYIGSCNASMFR
jgi:hypothetical protein